MKINREELLHALESVEPAVSQREILEQSVCLVFKDSKIIAFDDELACTAPSKLKSSFTGAVKASSLLDILRKLKEDDIDVDFKDSQLIITGKNKKTELTLESEITLPVDSVETPTEWKDLHEDFCEAINTVQGCASKDESQFHLTCIHVAPKWIEASDTYQISRFKLDTGLKESILLKKKALHHVAESGATKFSETETWVHFQAPTGLVISCRRYLEEFPDMTPYLNVEGGKTVTLPKGLDEAIARAGIFSADNADDDQILVSLSRNKLKLIGRGASGKHTEWRKIAYDGPDLSFYISPELITEIAKKYTKCQMTEAALRVDGGSWTYVTCLTVPDEETDVSSDEIGEKGKRNGHVDMSDDDEDDETVKKGKKKTAKVATKVVDEEEE